MLKNKSTIRKKMKILVSNDDGVYAPGLLALVEHLRAMGEVCVVAPDRDRSAASHSLSLTRPIRVNQLSNGFYSVQGTPTDCVHLALTGFLKEQPHIVVAGINAGANLGDDVLYSGTVAAASEGRFLGLPAIAISLVGKKYYDTAGRIAVQLLERLHNHPLPSFTLLNVNVPDIPYEALKGMSITRLGKRHCAEPMVKTVDPRGHTVYWVGPAGPEQDGGVGSDFYAINENKVSITPIHLDLTHYKSFDDVNHWLADLI